MSITDELREYARGCAGGMGGDALRHIADRIDAEHESACAEAYGNGVMSVPIALDESAMAEHGWVKLPVDADGVPIHVGDEVAFLGRMTVDATDGHNVFFFADNWTDGVYCVRADELRHYHAPTVEDVLREFGDWYAHTKGGCDEDGILAEYAAKLRLAEEVDA